MKLSIKKLYPDTKTPTYAHPGDVGFDMYAQERVEIAPGKRVTVGVGFAIAIPDGYAGLVWDKSGLSHKRGLKTLGGVYDAGFRGEINTGLLNTSDEIQIIEKGDKIGQMLIQAVTRVQFVEVDELDETERGSGQFGSTGT